MDGVTYSKNFNVEMKHDKNNINIQMNEKNLAKNKFKSFFSVITSEKAASRTMGQTKSQLLRA